MQIIHSSKTSRDKRVGQTKRKILQLVVESFSSGFRKTDFLLKQNTTSDCEISQKRTQDESIYRGKKAFGLYRQQLEIEKI